MKFEISLTRRLAAIAFICAQAAVVAPAATSISTKPVNSGSTSGQPFDCSKNPKLCTGNSGGGKGNTGPGNQGNDKPVGNTGNGSVKPPDTGSNSGGGGGNGGNNGNTFDCSKNPNLCTGNTGGGNGNTGPGNQGNGNDNGNAGGGGGNPGGGGNGGGGGGNGGGGGGNGGGGGTPPAEETPVESVAPPAEEKAKRTLKAKIEPLFYLDYDWATGIVAVDNSAATSTVLQFTESAPLYQKSVSELLEGGVGAALKFFFKNAAGTSASWWSQIGLIPLSGSEVTSVRYMRTLAQAKSAEGYKEAPLEFSQLHNWEAGDSVSYKSKGGLIFVAGTGLGLPGFTGTSIAQGTWETYVEKINRHQVYVKITKSKLDALSVGAGAGLAAIGLQKFDNSDDGFSFLITAKDERSRQVYQDLVRGNVLAAQAASKQAGAAVKMVESYKRVSKGKGPSIFVGLPIFLNATSSENKIQSFSTTDMHIEGTKVNADFGIYDMTVRTRAGNAHTLISRGFYGVKYDIFDLKTSAGLDSGAFGRFTWVFQDDNASTRSLHQTIETLVQATGLESLRVAVPNVSKDLEFTNVTVNMTLSERNTKILMNRIRPMSTSGLSAWASRKSRAVFAQKGAAVCKTINHDGPTCEETVTNEANYAAKQMQAALNRMSASAGSSVKFTKAYAEFGKAAMTNQVTLAMAMELAGSGVEVSFAMEGTHFKTHNVRFLSTGNGQLVMSADAAARKDASLDPQNKRSRFHGLITNRNLSGLGAPL